MTLLEHLRDYLIAEGIARKPAVAGAGHPLWLDPRHGVPAPGEGDSAVEIDADVVLGAFQVSGIPRGPYADSVLRTDAVDLWIRSRISPLAYGVDDALRQALVDRRAWDMAGMTIVESSLFRPLQRLGSDDDGYVFTSQYLFERRV